ncbi:unnamed protein product [Mytilus coruscus]|uniref:Uncharacterized protein n=1 Tax=Mytilus coruscus TaxID=42192 RepID=A0A6J8CIK5_MYTCO|nr:unnamed protein product [Mytilus coruscus]
MIQGEDFVRMLCYDDFRYEGRNSNETVCDIEKKNNEEINIINPTSTNLDTIGQTDNAHQTVIKSLLSTPTNLGAISQTDNTHQTVVKSLLSAPTGKSGKPAVDKSTTCYPVLSPISTVQNTTTTQHSCNPPSITTPPSFRDNDNLDSSSKIEKLEKAKIKIFILIIPFLSKPSQNNKESL